ncbi:hypothetical protein K5I29_08985 [Flavobacterium agricola]|uniref:Anti-sigma factor n=1 Tax=Flavobacterium agricola TaxID=2870839 RepID=A0ABY6M1C2_9FLAO|nr:hypothetical protein [Flavobacterium agricola]UYW00668.1 hypothetical protein K5I29_08985 [Flavobacterium agricola]
MEPLDKKIKELANEQRIEPSAQSWQHLASMLDKALPSEPELVNQATKNIVWKRYLSLAAVFALGFGFALYLLDSNKSENESENKPVVLVEVDSVAQPFLPDELDQDVNINLLPATQIASPKNSNADKNIIVAETENYVIPDSVIKSETHYATGTLQIEWENKQNFEVDVSPKMLLKQTERELNFEKANTELSKKEGKFQKIRMAISNRNYE